MTQIVSDIALEVLNLKGFGLFCLRNVYGNVRTSEQFPKKSGTNHPTHPPETGVLYLYIETPVRITSFILHTLLFSQKFSEY